MDLDELRDALDDIGNRTAVDPAAARADIGVRRDRMQRRRRAVALVSIAAATALVVATIALATTHGRKSVDIRPAGPTPDSSEVPTTTPKTATTTKTEPSTTAAPRTVDPLPAGSVMLQVSGRTISALGAQGNELGTLVTVYEARTVMDAQLMPDHRTIWYATRANDARSSCPEVVKLDLKTNDRTVVAHADDFALTPDGRKLVLVFPRSDAFVANNCQPVPLPYGVSAYEAGAAYIERDLTTGEQWTLPIDGYRPAGTGGPHGHPYIDTARNALITANCVFDGCYTSTYSVPEHSSEPISYAGAGPTCRCEALIAGNDGVYGVWGVEDSATQPPHTSVIRYPADRINGSGSVIAESNDVEIYPSVAPTAAGTFVLGSPIGTQGRNLYRVENGGLGLVGPTSAQFIFAVPPFAAT